MMNTPSAVGLFSIEPAEVSPGNIFEVCAVKEENGISPLDDEVRPLSFNVPSFSNDAIPPIRILI